MRVQSCYNPKIIHNPYTGEDITTPCGKCNACRNSRASQWVTRLDLESSCHRYNYFFTLTYDEQHLEQVIRLRKEDSNHLCYINGETGELYDLQDIHEQFSKKDFDYVYDTKVLNILSKRDFQLFIKRLRYYFNETDKNAKLRYYLTGEYGPSTYRPHGHCSLWFDSEKCAQKIEILLSKAWTFGCVYDPHRVVGSAAEYVASYINSFASLPKVYLHKGFRPFSLFSKSPALGSLYRLLGTEQELFNNGDYQFRRFDSKTNEFEDVPFWRSLESRLYPRCQRYSSLSFNDRVALYRKVAEFDVYELNAREIARRIQWEYLDSAQRNNSFFGRYFYEISHKYQVGYHFYHKDCDTSEYKDLPFLPVDGVMVSDITGDKCLTRIFSFESLVRFSRTCLRLIHQAASFGISIEDYITKMDLYYEKKSARKLTSYLRFQDEYFKNHPKWHLVYFDLHFYKKITTSDVSTWSFSTFATVEELFGKSFPTKIIDDKVVIDIPSFKSLKDYHDLVLLHDKIAQGLTKQKQNNDYALLHKDKFGNVLQYQNN